LRWDGIKEENGRKSINPLSFPEGPILKVQVDTKPLERQLAAVNILREMPHKKHEMLIRLFEKRVEEDKQWLQWPRPENNAYIKDNEWFVLKDEKRSGCPEQRNFIKKALNTPDFAILEGPPGSGKTTAILELICQLVSQKKRVLLCGSTNVAIDNILERLIEKDQNKSSLLERIDILPVRIGRPERVEQTIADYQIDNLIGENSTEDERNLKQRLLLDAANLVCGTTMGIVNHPKFKEQIGTNFNGNSPVIPEFDCLIIDESSKTTFQEFLVPALYAKRWILAGDVMQLSPFTERESIEFNFEKLSLKNNSEKYEVLDINIQRAVFFLNTIKSCLYWINGKIQGKNQNSKGNNHFVLPCLSDLLVKIVQELRSGRIDLFIHEELFIFVTKDEIIMTDKESIQPSQHEQILLRTLKTVNYLELTAADVIFVDSSIIEQIIEKLPETHAILQLKDWETMPHAFYHNVFQQKGKFGYFHRQFGSQNSFEIVNKLNEDIKERSWAQEIAWRIDSEHQLRLVDKSRRKEKLGGEIDELTPCSVDKGNFEEARNMISAISFPSILESLRFGIKGKKPIVPSTISEGFYPDTLEDRKITLTFQHRMHPDISIFPRRQYYKDTNALLDLEAPKPIRESRKWDYDYYKKRGIEKRSIWVNVRSPTTGSRNIYEVEAMTQHLKYFLEYAVIHPQPEGKTWEVACLAFYKGQEKLIREGGYNNKTQYNVNGLQTITENYRSNSNFNYNRDKTKGPYPVFIRLHTVDRFQGHEADVVLLSMSQTKKDGFLDNPNRLNVSITRAKFQLLIFGKYEYFSKYSHSDDLKALALAHENSII
jgi:DNA polymerase III delta prime subunit